VSSESSCALRLARHSQNAWARHVECVESSRVESSQVEFEPIGLYSSTSCCVSHRPSQWERARPLSDPGHDTVCKILGGYVDVGGLGIGQIASLTHESLSFLILHRGHRSHLWTHPHVQYVIIRRSGQGSALWGSER